MKFEDLPADMQRQVNGMKHYSMTIQSDVLDALENAENLEVFRSQVDDSMNELIGEAQKVRQVLGAGNGVIVHG